MNTESKQAQPEKFNVSAALAQAKFHERKKQFDAARRLYQSVLEAFPQHRPAQKALKA